MCAGSLRAHACAQAQAHTEIPTREKQRWDDSLCFGGATYTRAAQLRGFSFLFFGGNPKERVPEQATKLSRSGDGKMSTSAARKGLAGCALGSS